MKDEIRKIFNYPTDTPLKFWLKYWTHNIKELSELDSYNMRLDNPHFTLNDIVLEIKYNSFKNNENRKLFKEILGKYLKSDKVFFYLYHTQCTLALADWDDSPLYVNSICKTILQSMNRGDYLNAIAKELKSIIDKGKSLTEKIKSDICLYTNLLITEFICLGVDIYDLNNFINEDAIVIQEGGKIIVAPDTYYNLSKNKFRSQDLYYEAISKRLRDRSAEDYINNIMKHFYKQPEEGHVILRVIGFKDSINLYIQGIHIYSVDNVTYLKEPHLSKIEKFDESFQFVNVAVPVSHRFFHTSINIAKEKANNILDFISLNINPPKELYISDQFAAIEINGKEYGSTESIKNNLEYARFYRDMESYDISNIADKLPEYHKEVDNSKSVDNESFIKLINAIHWQKRAKCSERYEDKLLYSWIAIEGLLKIGEEVKLNVIKKPKECNILNLTRILCSCTLARNYFYSYARNNYAYLIEATQEDDNYFDLSPSIIENAKLNIQPGECLKVSYFLNSLSSIIDDMNDEVYKCELNRLKDFYNKDGLKDFKDRVSEDVTLIYRLRNLTVHNAVYSQFQIKLYAHKMQFLSGSLIQAIQYHCNKYGMNIEEAVLKIYTDYQIFEKNIASEIKSLKDS